MYHVVWVHFDECVFAGFRPPLPPLSCNEIASVEWDEYIFHHIYIYIISATALQNNFEFCVYYSIRKYLHCVTYVSYCFEKREQLLTFWYSGRIECNKMGKKEKLTSQQKETLYEIVINLVRENPMFYDKTHPDYKNKEKRNKKWTELKEILNTSLKFQLKKGKFPSNICNMW